MRFVTARLFGLCLLSSALLPVACDDGPDAPPGAGAGGGGTTLDASQVATLDDYVQRLTEAFCDHLVVPCCTGNEAMSRELCVSRLAPELREELLEDGGGNYLPQVGAACVAAVNKLSCGQGDDPSFENCDQVFERVARPGKAPLEACTTSQECGSPANGRATCEIGACSSNGGCTPAACHVEITVGAGEPCTSFAVSGGNPNPPPAPVDDGYYRVCPSGQTCDSRLAMCKPTPKAGEPCDFVCAGDAICDGKTCRALAPEGSPCVSQSDCRSFECTAGMCTARPVEQCPFDSSSPAPPGGPTPAPAPAPSPG